MKLTRIVLLVVLGLSTHFYAYIIKVENYEDLALSDSADLESSSEDRELESSFDTGSSEDDDDDDDDDIELLGDYVRQELSELEDEVGFDTCCL